MEICDFSENLVGHYAQVTCVALAEEEAFAVSGSEDTTIKVWSIIMGCVITDYRVSVYYNTWHLHLDDIDYACVC